MNKSDEIKTSLEDCELEDFLKVPRENSIESLLKLYSEKKFSNLLLEEIGRAHV